MPDKKTFRSLRLSFVGVLLFLAVWIILSEAGILPTDYITTDPQTDYTLNVASIFTAFGGTFFALRLFAFKRIKESVEQTDDNPAFKCYTKWAALRIALIGVAVATNVVLYYASSHTESAKYCLIIALIGTLFCWPSAGEYERLHMPQK